MVGAARSKADVHEQLTAELTERLASGQNDSQQRGREVTQPEFEGKFQSQHKLFLLIWNVFVIAVGVYLWFAGLVVARDGLLIWIKDGLSVGEDSRGSFKKRLIFKS